ncbi:MAG: GntR family transcriptional regulator [Firmicutes bacterium]|nr:GntR family transcriptional regulator [Bacillota bacterium]
MNLPKIDTSNLLDKTYTILKDRIINRQFKPNQKLSIPDLCQQLGVSRTPVRDALNRLEQDGLVKTVPKVGTFVNAVEEEDVLDAIDTRLMLECWVVDKLASLSDAELTQLTQALAKILDDATALIETAPFETFLRSNYNLAFHMTLMRAGKNKRNEDLYLNLMHYHRLASQYSLITKNMAALALHQHYSIVKALQNKQFDAAKQAIRDHLDDSRQQLIKEMSEKSK